jgi:uncharacterized protein (TIGR03435 family)
MPQKPTFEVASVKPHDPAQRGSAFRMTPGRLDAVNIALSVYIARAYGLRTFQFEGLPEWTQGTHYDIAAKIADTEERGARPADQSRVLMECLRTLLEDRFQLRFHREKKALPAYSLVVANGGFKLKPSDPSQPHPGTSPQGGGAFLLTKFTNGKFVNTYWNYTAAQLAATLTSLFDRETIDNTGLTGTYDYTLVMSAEPGTAAQPSEEGAPGPEAGESIYTPLRDMGLKLESARAETDMFVIDRVEKPVEN